MRHVFKRICRLASAIALLPLSLAMPVAKTGLAMTDRSDLPAAPGACPTVGPSPTYTLSIAPPYTGVNWSGCNLTNANMSGFDFGGANLSGATLTNANMSGSSFAGAANLSFAILVNANLSNAVLYAYLNNSNFTGANLTNAVMNGSQANDANFTNAALTNAAIASVGLKRSNFTGANLSVDGGWTAE